MLPQEILAILGVLRCILVHSESYIEAHRAFCEEAHHHYHQHLLNYWNWKPFSLARAYTKCIHISFRSSGKIYAMNSTKVRCYIQLFTYSYAKKAYSHF